MRTTFNSTFRMASDSIEVASERLQDYQRQVTSGRRVSTASEDPSGALEIVRERAETATVERYSRSANSVNSRLAVMDTVLADIVDKLGAAETAAMSAVGTIDQARLEAASQQLAGIRDALFVDFNASFGGSQIFSGSNTTSSAYVRNPDGTVSAYLGNTTEVEVDVDRGRAIHVTVAASTIAQGTDADDVFTTLQNLIDAAQAGDSATLTNGITALKRAFARATTAHSRIGNDMTIVEGEKLRLDEFRRASAARLSKIEDANMAEAITGMTQAETALRAAFGATATMSRVSLMDYLK